MKKRKREIWRDEQNKRNGTDGYGTCVPYKPTKSDGKVLLGHPTEPNIASNYKKGVVRGL